MNRILKRWNRSNCGVELYYWFHAKIPRHVQVIAMLNQLVIFLYLTGYKFFDVIPNKKKQHRKNKVIMKIIMLKGIWGWSKERDGGSSIFSIFFRLLFLWNGYCSICNGFLMVLIREYYIYAFFNSGQQSIIRICSINYIP